MPVFSTLSTPIATPIVNPDGTINMIWNEFFVRLMKNAGVTVSVADLEADVAELETTVESIETEVSKAITMTDSDGNLAVDLAVLYDGNKASDGVEYVLSGTDKYIQYKYGVEDYIDRIAVYTNNANGRAYVGYSSDGTTWNYLKAEDDHTLTSAGKLVIGISADEAGRADAAVDYWQLAAGANIAIFPNNIFAKYVRFYFTGTYTTTVYELIPSRILISEMAAISNLATLSATFGAVGGYASITDAPQTEDIVNFTTIETASLTRLGNTLEKTGTSGWDSQSYSTASYTGGARVSFTPTQTNKLFMIGLDANPTQDAGYLNIDYAMFCNGSTGNLQYYESSATAVISTSYAVGDLLEVIYTGANVIYKQNGTTLRTVAASSDLTLYMDSSFYSTGAKVTNIQFGSYTTNDSFLSSGYTTIVGDVISVYSDTVTIASGINDRIDWKEDSTTYYASLTLSTTYTPITLAAHIQAIMRAEGDSNTTVTYSAVTTKVTIANSTLTTFELLWNTGTYEARSCGATIGFDTSADDTGALTYDSDRGCGLRVLIGDLS